VPHHPTPRQPLPVWERLATWLAFLAVLSALWAPVSMLAQDVQTGKLGGICSINTASSNASGDAADGDAGSTGLRCDLCASPGLALPPLPVATAPCFSGDYVAVADVPASAGAAVPGLPFSRGPPAL
jgi:hypothetical protein